MNELFNQETINLVMDLLKTAADGSVTVLIVYFALPALMLLISTGAWLWFGLMAIKAIKFSVDKYISTERTKILKVDLRNHKLFINAETEKSFIALTNELKEHQYIHESDIEWLRVAVQNQKLLDEERDGNSCNPAKYIIKKYL